jgi:hypothetical protein
VSSQRKATGFSELAPRGLQHSRMAGAPRPETFQAGDAHTERTARRTSRFGDLLSPQTLSLPTTPRDPDPSDLNATPI